MSQRSTFVLWPDSRPDPILSRVRRIIGEVDLDCACRVMLDGALDRFFALEVTRRRATVLRDGRDAKAAIATLLELLADLDETGDTEGDSSVFGEFADLFDTIAAIAVAGAEALRRLEEA